MLKETSTYNGRVREILIYLFIIEKLSFGGDLEKQLF